VGTRGFHTVRLAKSFVFFGSLWCLHHILYLQSGHALQGQADSPLFLLFSSRPAYNFYDGPPFATGLPHYGHILAGTIKAGEESTFATATSQVNH